MGDLQYNSYLQQFKAGRGLGISAYFPIFMWNQIKRFVTNMEIVCDIREPI